MKCHFKYFIFLFIFQFVVLFGQSQNLRIRPEYQQECKSIIQTCFHSDSLIREGFNELKKIDTSTIEMIIVYSFYIENIEENILQINKYELPLKIDFAANDSLHFMERMNYLTIEAAKLKTEINHLKSNLDELYYKKGLYFYSEHNNQKAIESFKNAIKTNRNFSMAYYDLAKLYCEQRRWNEALITLNNAYSATNSKDHESFFIRLSGNIIKNILHKSDSLIAAEQFNKALEMLKGVANYYSNSWINNYKEDVEKCFASAHNGSYESFLKIARKAIEKDKLSMSESLVKEATQYQMKNSSYVKTNEKAQNVIMLIGKKYIDKGKRLNATGQYLQAIEQCNKVKNLYSEYKIPLTNDLIECVSSANKGIYSHLIKQDSVQKKMPVEVKTEKTVEKQKIIISKEKKNIPENNKIEKVKSDLIESIKAGNIKAWANELIEARQILQNALEMQKTNSLNNDSMVNHAIILLKEKIKNRECDNVQDEYNNLVLKANRKIKELNFIEAEDYYSKAIQVAKSDESCKVDSTVASVFKRKYNKPVAFQKMINDSKKLLEQKNYQDFFKKYQDAGIYYFQSNISEYGVDYMFLPKYVSESRNNELSIQAIYFLIEQNQLREAFSLLDELKNRGFSQELSKDIQEKLGRSMSVKDYKINPNIKPNENILSYTNNDKWFKYFKTAYLKFWGKVK